VYSKCGGGRGGGGWPGFPSRPRERMGDNNFVTSLVSTNVTGLRFERAARQNERADPSACEPTGQRVAGRSTEQNPNDLHSPVGRPRHADAVQHTTATATTATERNVTHTSHTAQSRARTQYTSCRRVSLAFPEDGGGKNAAAYARILRDVYRGDTSTRVRIVPSSPPSPFPSSNHADCGCRDTRYYYY